MRSKTNNNTGHIKKLSESYLETMWWENWTGNNLCWRRIHTGKSTIAWTQMDNLHGDNDTSYKCYSFISPTMGVVN